MKHKNIACSGWEESKAQQDKLCEGDGKSMSNGLSAKVPMYNDYEKWEDRGYGPNPYPKSEKCCGNKK